MIMINFINFVFSLKSKHENKKQYGNHTPSLGNTFFVSQKNNLQLIELEWGASKCLLQQNRRWKPYRGEVSIYKHLFISACQTT